MDEQAHLSSMSGEVIEELLQKYRENPESVDKSWQDFFQGFELGFQRYHSSNGKFEASNEFKVINLIDDYRKRGHLFTETNPVRTRREYSPTLDIDNFGLSKEDLKKPFNAGTEIGIGKTSLEKIIGHLEETYCKSVGVEFMYIRNPEIEDWLQKKMESVKNKPDFTRPQKKKILEKLREAVYFEKFIHKKFPGQKRFSLEGAESLIPALEVVIQVGAELGTEEFIIGMAHRGRLNVLANIMNKSLATMFSEFGGLEYDDRDLLGDVKYHLGFTSNRSLPNDQNIRLTLAPNPSHLEAVNPIVEGISRARIDLKHKGDQDKITPILIHGDASIAGQGVVYEVLQMSELQGYTTGGTIHLVINNQIGFTTNYLDGRTSTYCTDVAKVIQAPIFHVNGDDAEAVVYTIQLAMEFREKFNRDVFIDLLCYRKYGHNESDEPRFTQPILYKQIEKHPDPYSIYKKKILEDKILTKSQIEEDEKSLNDHMELGLSDSKSIVKAHIDSFLSDAWEGIRKAKREDFCFSPQTNISNETLEMLAQKISNIPSDVPIFRKIKKLQDDRRKMVFDTNAIDWGMAELLAYGSLLNENVPVRVSGQDVERGTFSHRHAVLKIEDSEEEYVPLEHISENQAEFEIYNSPLSEYGVLGFEYGYALASPNTLTIWEAQFGDFGNGAQIIFDQFLSSAEDKWNVMNDLVVLLPHGYEGQGPEHSSARMERYLSLCAENNFQVANVSTPANFFHLLRRQVHREFRKPLVVFTPKSLLRHPECISPVEDFTNDGFKEVIDDIADPDKVTRVMFCSGKVYYDLIKEKREKNREDVAVVRIEQLYPIPLKQLKEIVKKYNNAVDWYWVQEEPGNMGPWTFYSRNFKEVKMRMIARPDSGSPATGSSQLHKIRQRKIVEKAFGECDCGRIKEECRMICSQKDY